MESHNFYGPKTSLELMSRVPRCMGCWVSKESSSIWNIKKENGSLSVRVHCHDRNMSVQSWVRGDKDTEVTNDTWHASKNVAKEINVYVQDQST